jgi:hypothetical protein
MSQRLRERMREAVGKDGPQAAGNDGSKAVREDGSEAVGEDEPETQEKAGSEAGGTRFI